MEIYLVGGAVRDQLLGLPVKEKDYVVVGATPNDMLKQGFLQVGKDFPVFLHPQTKEEYALARMERKVGRGYTGFEFDVSPQVTLEEDLLRRDLTINAIAQSAAGVLIDPFRGQQDLEKRLLRHVSPAFVEDPVRILRVARFAARFASLGFQVAPETVQLMHKMAESGEVDALVAERVWKELERALQEKNPETFFEVLTECRALSVLFPQLENAQAIIALKQAAKNFNDSEVRFAALLHHMTSIQIKELCERYRIPSSYRELAVLVADHYPRYLNARNLSPEELLALLQSAGAFRQGNRFQQFLQVCVSLSGLAQNQQFLSEVLAAAEAFTTKDLASSQLSGKEIGEYVTRKRIEYIKDFIEKTNLSNK